MRSLSACNAGRFIVTGDSRVSVWGQSSQHAFRARATRLRGFVEANFVNGRIATEPPPKMHLEIPVAGIAADDQRVDTPVQRVIGSAVNPDVLAELKTLSALEDAHRYAAAGSITVNGKKQAVTGTIEVSREGDRVRIRGRQILDIRRFGIEIPRVLMFAVRPEVTVEFDVVAEVQGERSDAG